MADNQGSSPERVSDERLAALIQCGAPGGLAPRKVRRSRAKLMSRAIAAGQRFAKRAEKLPYFQSATDAYTRGWMAGYRAHRNDVEPPAGYITIPAATNVRCYGCDCDGSPERVKDCHESGDSPRRIRRELTKEELRVVERI